MSQPRKEQVKNLKTKYTRFNSVGNLTLSGGPTQNVINTISELYYDNFLAVTRTGSGLTGSVTGAETSSPAIAYGGFPPAGGWGWELAAGYSFNITMPGVNGGLPVEVIIQSSDVKTWGAAPPSTGVTISRMVARINATLSGVGVSTPVASNVDGQLVLTSADTSGRTYGSAASITLQDGTGLISLIGFISGTTHTGVLAPNRGIITQSADGLGGYVQLRGADGTIAESVNQCMRHCGNFVYVPETLPGQSVYARMRAFPGPHLNGESIRFDYYRIGATGPSIVTSGSDFGTIGGYAITLAIDFGNGALYTPTVTFTTPSTAQSVVDQINAVYSGMAGEPTSKGSVVTSTKEPFYFTDPSTHDSFFISFNGYPNIHINPPATVSSASDFATYINAQITAAGQASQGIAVASSGAVIFRSLNTDPTVSSVAFLSGNPGGVLPGTFMETLNMLGIVPGTYRGSRIASLYGTDEILIALPSALPGATLTITGAGAAMTKMGLPSSPVLLTTTQGIQKTTVPTVHALIPEMVEFSEEPDSYDSEVQTFDSTSEKQQVPGTDGIQNIGVAAILDAVGKIDESILPLVLSFLNVDTLRLGDKSRALGEQTSRAKMEFPQAGTTGLILAHESRSSVVTDPPVRMYLGSGSMLVTINAKASTYPITNPNYWTRDIIGSNSTLLEIKPAGQIATGWQSSASWADAAWNRTVLTPSVPTKSGLDERYRHLSAGTPSAAPETYFPDNFTAEDTPGAGAWFIRDGAALTGYSQIGVTGSQYSDPINGIYAVKLRDIAPGGCGSVGFTVYGKCVAVSDGTASPYGQGLASFLHLVEHLPSFRYVSAPTYVAPNAACLINSNTVTLNDAGVSWWSNIGLTAVAPWYDLVEVIWNDGSGLKPHTYVITSVVSATQVTVVSLDGNSPVFPAGAANVKCWHSIRFAVGDGVGAISLSKGLFYSALPYSSDGEAKFAATRNMWGYTALAWGGFDNSATTGGYKFTGTLLGDGSISAVNVTSTTSNTNVASENWLTWSGVAISLLANTHFLFNSAISGGIVTISTAAKAGAKYVMVFQRSAIGSISTFTFSGGGITHTWDNPSTGSSNTGILKPAGSGGYDMFIGEAITSTLILWTVNRF